MGCTIGGKLAGQPPLPARPRTLWFLQLSLLGFFKLFLADVPGLSLRWESDPAMPPTPWQFLPAVPGVRDYLFPGCLLPGCTIGGKLTGQLSPPRYPGLVCHIRLFTTFLVGECHNLNVLSKHQQFCCIVSHSGLYSHS